MGHPCVIISLIPVKTLLRVERRFRFVIRNLVCWRTS